MDFNELKNQLLTDISSIAKIDTDDNPDRSVVSALKLDLLEKKMSVFFDLISNNCRFEMALIWLHILKEHAYGTNACVKAIAACGKTILGYIEKAESR